MLPGPVVHVTTAQVTGWTSAKAIRQQIARVAPVIADWKLHGFKQVCGAGPRGDDVPNVGTTRHAKQGLMIVVHQWFEIFGYQIIIVCTRSREAGKAFHLGAGKLQNELVFARIVENRALRQQRPQADGIAI